MSSKQKNELIPLIIWGASGHARVVADIVRLTKRYTVFGFLDDIDDSRKGTIFCGAKILGGQEQFETLKNNNISNFILGFGDCEARLALSIKLTDFGFTLITVIHPSAVIASDVIIGSGSTIMAGVVVNSGTVINENVIINTSASIDHDCVIEKGVHISPGVHVGGGVTIGTGTWIGIGAIIKNKIEIGHNVVVGAGAVVLNDIPDGVTAFGVPAKVFKKGD